MRVVLDTNLLVSGVLNPHGAPGQVVKALVLGTLCILYDDRILDEYREALLRPAFGFDRTDIEVLVDLIERDGDAVLPQALRLSLPDSGDLPCLEVAVSGTAEALITGNTRHFRPAQGWVSVPVLTPAEFVTKHLRS